MANLAKTVLVLGATGNTGFPLVKQLLTRGYSVRVIVRSLDRQIKDMNIKSFEKNHPFSTFFFSVCLRLKPAAHIQYFLADSNTLQNNR